MNTFDIYAFNNFLDPDEKIEEVIHKHWIALLEEIVKTVVFGILVPLLLIWLYPTSKVLIVGLVWSAAGIGHLAYNFFDWYLDAILLTNENVLDIEWNGFFNKIANRIKYEYIESVSYTVDGLLATLFKFGDLNIMTHHEGEKGLKMTTRVRDMQKLVLNKRDEVLARTEGTDSDQLKKALKAFIREGGMIDEQEKSQEKPITSRNIWVTNKRKIQ